MTAIRLVPDCVELQVFGVCSRGGMSQGTVPWMLSKPQLRGTAKPALESGGHPQVASILRRCSQMGQTYEASPGAGER